MSKLNEIEGEILVPDPTREAAELATKSEDFLKKFVYPYQRGEAKKELDSLFQHVRLNR